MDQALLKAKSYAKKGEIEEAQQLYQAVLQAFPMNKRAQKGLAALNKSKQSAATQSPPQEVINQLINLYNQGQLGAVVEQAQAFTEQYPEAFIIWNILGAANKGLGRVQAASEAFKKVTELNPTYADGFSNLGITLKDQGKFDEAIASYNKALSLKPDYADAYNNMGNALQDQGKPDEAIASFNKALSLKPDYAEAYNNMGAALKDQGKLDEAIASYNKALSLKSDYAEAYYNMGKALRDQGKLDDAIKAYSKALSLKPDYAGAYNNMGNALKDQGKPDEAIASYKKALSLKPDYAEAYNNMGVALKDQGKLEEAIEAYNKALSIKPDYAGAYNNMGIALQDQGKLDDAIKAYSKALSLKPDYAEALSQAYHTSALMSEWANTSALSGSLLSGKLHGQQSVYGLLALADKPSMHLEKTNGLIIEKYKNTPRFEITRGQYHKRIKIGYFSSYFRSHPVSVLSTRMLEHTNREQFEIFGFHYGPDTDDKYSLRLKHTFDHFVNVSTMTDKQIAESALKKGIDIAIEFNGFMAGARIGILAHRPAPIQINYLAYPGTMGGDFYDYIIADEVVIPNENKEHYSENIIYLPNCYMPQDNTRRITKRPVSRADVSLPEHGFVFCCFNNSFKISPREFDIWAKLLNKVNRSVLWLMKSNKWSEKNLRNEASKRGVDPNRLVFADKLPLEEHLGRLRLADLFLDTFNFNAHTTASDALWAGVPIVTKIGKSFAARVAASLLTAIELPELITTTEKEYEALALSLAKNPNKFMKIKSKLAEKKNSAPLFDTETYTKNLELAYVQAYKRYKDGLPPAEFKVS